MNDNDLLKKLGLEGVDETDTPGCEIKKADGHDPPVSPTALEIDEWGLRRGQDLLAESERLRATGIDEYAAADFHAAAFEPTPRLSPACVDVLRHRFLDELLRTPDYVALHESTALEPVSSSIAAVAFAEQFARFRDEHSTNGTATDGDTDSGMSAVRAAGKAAAEAKDEVDMCEEAKSSLGMGPGSSGTVDHDAIAALFRRVRSDPALRKIVEAAGRFRRVAQSKQRTKTRHGLDDVVGIGLGSDLGRVLPHELARLADDDLSAEAMRRLLEGGLMCREHTSPEPQAEGPIIVAVDESGSMVGQKVTQAKALALAMAWIAGKRHRWCALVAFSGDTGERVLPLLPGRWNSASLCEWLSDFIGGGSDLDVPVREMPRIYADLKAPMGRTDIIFLTDAVCRIPTDVRETFVNWKLSVRARLISLIIGEKPGDLSFISDECHTMATLDPSGDAVEEVLSV